MEDNKKIPNGIYFRLLTEIAPKIYAAILARDDSAENYKLYDNIGRVVGIDMENIASDAVRHAKALINEIYENRFNND